MRKRKPGRFLRHTAKVKRVHRAIAFASARRQRHAAQKGA